MGGSESAEGEKHGVINSTSIEEKNSDDFSKTASSVAVESKGSVFRFSVLDADTVVRGGVLAWGVLGTRRGRVLKTVEGFLDIILDRDVASASIVVSIEVKAAVGLAFPIFMDRVIFLESIS